MKLRVRCHECDNEQTLMDHELDVAGYTIEPDYSRLAIMTKLETKARCKHCGENFEFYFEIRNLKVELYYWGCHLLLWNQKAPRQIRCFNKNVYDLILAKPTA